MGEQNFSTERSTNRIEVILRRLELGAATTPELAEESACNRTTLSQYLKYLVASGEVACIEPAKNGRGGTHAIWARAHGAKGTPAADHVPHPPPLDVRKVTIVSEWPAVTCEPQSIFSGLGL